MPPHSDRLNLGWAVALATGLAIVALASAPPFVGEGARGYLMQAFAAVCHQLPGRSPHVDGVQLAVCHRCYGIYLGLPVAALLYVYFRRRILPPQKRLPLILGLSMLPMVIDWGGEVAGLFLNTPGSRLATGLVFGLTAGYFFVLSLVDSRRKKTPTAPPD